MGNLGGWEILIVLVVLVALFGAKRLPDMARSIGQSARVFKGEMKGLKEDDKGSPKSPEMTTETVAEKRTETPGPTAQ